MGCNMTLWDRDIQANLLLESTPYYIISGHTYDHVDSGFVLLLQLLQRVTIVSTILGFLEYS